MRIIAGTARGRRIKAPDTRDTRPATDRVREAVFSSLGDIVVGSAVGDLYAGSGSFGLEALSRGASSAVFVESGRRALQALATNISAVGLGGTIERGTVRSFLSRSEGRFDLVFMDPPWDHPGSRMGEELILLDRMLAPGGTVVVSRRHGDSDPPHPETWRVAAEKRYGDTKIIRYEKR
jgi:16S rRNA (guanine966-N2)-methyltransferase